MKPVIECLQLGAYAFLMKPVNVDELLITAERALEHRELLIERRRRGDSSTLALPLRRQDVHIEKARILRSIGSP